MLPADDDAHLAPRRAPRAAIIPHQRQQAAGDVQRHHRKSEPFEARIAFAEFVVPRAAKAASRLMMAK